MQQMKALNTHLPSLQADSPDAKDELACLEMKHQETFREVSTKQTEGFTKQLLF